MATSKVIIVPDAAFSGLYYPQLLEALIQFKRINVPELTDESDFEPLIQLIRMVALTGHLNNVLIDLVADESTLPTAKLPETVRNMLRLIGFNLKPAAPAQLDILYQLSKVFTAPFLVISASAQAATVNDGTGPVIFFEALEALTIDRTDQLSAVFVDNPIAGPTSVFTDHTADANTPNAYTPWPNLVPGSAIYFGHLQAMWDVLNLDVNVPGASFAGVWEFYDGQFSKIAPTAVLNTGFQLEVDLTSYLGVSNLTGTKIRVQLNSTTAFEDVLSTWNGMANIATVSFLGQSSPSLVATDYTVGSDWQRFPDVVDGTVVASQSLSVTGDVKYGVPQNITQNWAVGTVNGVEAFWVRFRVITAPGSPASPNLRRARIDTGKQYVLRSATQGQTVLDSPLGSSTGLPAQSFATSQDFFVTGSETVTVDSEAWTRVENFLASQPTDKHYVVVLGVNDRASILFGDGNAGRIPPIGVGNIVSQYRHGANDNGNVGALTATVDKTGLTYVNKLYNPRAAAGWAAAQGSDTASLERAKIEGPASLRVKQVAVSPDDVVELTKSFTDANASRPYARARAFEEGFGPKTIELVVCANGGALASNQQLSDLQDYFNGDQFAHPPIVKHLVANQEVTPINYNPKAIDITATVISATATVTQIETRLNQVFQPDALKDDGVTYEWEFGGEVPTSRIIAEIFKANDDIVKVTLAIPAGNITLQSRDLPRIGAVNITVLQS